MGPSCSFQRQRFSSCHLACMKHITVNTSRRPMRRIRPRQNSQIAGIPAIGIEGSGRTYYRPYRDALHLCICLGGILTLISDGLSFLDGLWRAYPSPLDNQHFLSGGCSRELSWLNVFAAGILVR